VATLASPSPSAAAGGTTLPLNGFFDMVVDADRGHVFVSGGPGNSSIAVMNLDGSLAATIPDLPGAAGMALVGSSLYVARAGGAAIDVVDASTLSKTGTIDLPFATGGALAHAGGRLWMLGGACATWAPLASVDPSDGSSKTYSKTFYCPIFATSPTDPNVLVVGEEGLSPTTVYRYDVSTDPPTLAVEKWNAAGASNLSELAVTPDGTKILLASGSPYHIPELRLSDLEATGLQYPTGPYPVAVDVTAAGSGYVAGGVYAPYDDDVYVFPSGSATPVQTFERSSTGDLAESGLAFGPSAYKLFAVTTNGSTAVFHSLPGPAALSTTLSLSASSTTVSYPGSVTLTAHLDAFDDSDNDVVAIYKTPSGGSRSLVTNGPVDAAGNISATVSLNKNTTFVAEWQGDERYGNASSPAVLVKVRVKVTTRLSRHYGTSGRYKLYRLGRSALVKGTVVPNHSGDPLRFVAQRLRNGTWRAVSSASFTIEPDGSAYALFTAATRGSYRLRNSFASDEDHLGNTSAWVFARFT
jgi:hypothetical protein